jgi:enolase-phosphatase E1
MRIRAILLDIEGTTSSIDFVHDTLFPYAARELPGFIASHANEPDVASLLDDVREEANAPEASVEDIGDILAGWMQADRKSTPLKALQGMVWKKGYDEGDFKGHVYPDTAPSLRKWANDGLALYIYSSGSVDAQKLLFGHSEAGDLRPLISAYFDTRVGPKQEASSYRRIIESLELGPERILFLSDVAAELDAAAQAGMQTMQLVRDNRAVPGSHETVTDFAAVAIPSRNAV